MSGKKYIIFHCDGGQGKNIAATAVVEAIKKKYPEYHIIVVCGWEEVWFNNPNIYRVYKFGGLPYFYEDFIANDDIEDLVLLRHDVYFHQNQIMEKQHLIQNWCEMFNIPFNGEMPKVYLTPREIQVGSEILKLHQDKRPIFLIQTNGGMAHGNNQQSWMRDMPLDLAQETVNRYVNKGYRCIHIRHENQPQLQNVETATMPLRDLYSLILYSKVRFLVDSFVQHIAAAYQLPSTVLWIGNKPHVFGYGVHDNIISKKDHDHEFLKYSYLNKYDISGMPTQCPYNNYQDLFNYDEILKSLEKQEKA
jgi:ADP-heptose:LPS heptosyltransferase